MTIKECYEKIGGDYAQVEERLPSPELIEKFVVKFQSDGSYQQLCETMEKGQAEDAFRAAHTLKSVCGNLSFIRLYESASQLTELLRNEMGEIPEEAFKIMEDVKKNYELVTDTVRKFIESAK